MEKEIQNKWEQTAKYSRKNAQDFLLFSSSLSLFLSRVRKQMRHVANANQIKTLGNIYTLIATKSRQQRERGGVRQRERERTTETGVAQFKTCFQRFSLFSFGSLFLFYDSPAFSVFFLACLANEGGQGLLAIYRYSEIYDMHKMRTGPAVGGTCNLMPSASCVLRVSSCKLICWKCAKNVFVFFSTPSRCLSLPLSHSCPLFSSPSLS